MRHRLVGRKLGRPTGHRLALLRNLVTDLLKYERIRTTEPKAEEVQREAERLITKAKQGGLHARRQLEASLYDRSVAVKLLNEVAPRFAERSGGYTRLTKIGHRRGDAAPMAQLELV